MKKVKERRGLTLLLCLTMIASLFPAPAKPARAANAPYDQSFAILCASQNVGTARLRREGAALILDARIDDGSAAYMTRIRLKSGETTLLDASLSGGEQRSYIREHYGVDASAAAFDLLIDLAMPGSGEQVTNFLSGKNIPDGVVVEKNSANANPDHAWNRLVYEPESQKLGAESFGPADSDGFVNRVLKGTGAQWVYPVADSASREGGNTARMQGKFHLDANRIVKKAVLMIAADDGYAFRLNNVLLPLPASSDMVIGADDTPMEKVIKPAFPKTSASFNFQHVVVYDLLSEGVDLKSGDNPYTVSVFNKSDISGVIFALRVTTAPLLIETFHQAIAFPAGAVRVSLAIQKINGIPVTGVPAIAPGDKLTIVPTLTNEGTARVRPGELTVTMPVGLYAESPADCRRGNGARLVLPESTEFMEPSAQVTARDFVAVVDMTALGALRDALAISARMPFVYSETGAPLENAAGLSNMSLDIAPAASAAGTGEFRVSNVLGRVSEMYRSGTVGSVQTGDRLEYVLYLDNQGGQPVTADRIEIGLNDALMASEPDLLPGWSLSGNGLVYNGAVTIPSGQAIALPYSLRVATGASGSAALRGRVHILAPEQKDHSISADYPISAAATRLTVTHEFVSADNGRGWGVGRVEPGGRVLLRMKLKNDGNVSVRPRSVKLDIPKGLEACGDDNPLPLWQVEEKSLILRDGAVGMLPPNESASVSYILRASPYMEGTEKSIAVQAVDLVNVNQDSVANYPSTSSLKFAVSGRTPEYKLKTSANLLRVDDRAASGARILPGSRLTFALQMKNEGNRPVRPMDFAIALPAGLYADPKDNSQPMWTASGDALTYAHGSETIAPDATVVREFTLRVRDDAQAGNLKVSVAVPMLIGPFSDVKNVDSTMKFYELSVSPAPECAIAVTQTIDRINDEIYGVENHTIRTGDTIAVQVQMENRGSREARLGPVTFTPPYGLQVIHATPEEQWTIEADKLTYTPKATEIIGSGQVQKATYHLRVGVTASGERSIPCAAAQVTDNTGAQQPNAIAPAAARLYVDGVTGTYKLATSHVLVRINDKPVEDAGIPRPGDLLTFEMRLHNQGNQPVYPKPIAITLTGGLSAEGNGEPPWKVGANTLTYTYPDAAPIPAEETRTAAYTLRLGLDAAGAQRVESAAPPLETGDRAAVINAASAARLDIEVGPPQAAALRVTHRILKVNGQEAADAYAARPGDELIMEMTLKNAGRMALYPAGISIKHSKGLYAQAGDNPSPWTLAADALECDLKRNRIDPDQSEVLQYVLRVDDEAEGEQWVETNVPKVIDDRGCEVQNDTAQSRAEITLLPPLSVSLVASSRLAYINDQEVPVSYTVRPGDKLTFEMSLKNTGQKAVKPKSLLLSWSEGLYLQESDNENPPWVKEADGLSYVHEGTTIAVGATQKRYFTLRARGDANGEHTVRAELAQVIDAIGGTLANETPEALTKLTVSDALIPSLKITHRLSRINDVTVGSVYTIHPGDKLTFTMVLENDGNVAVRPDAVKVNFSSGLAASERGNSNPPWSLREGTLVYTHEGGTIPAGGVRSVEYHLTVNANAKGQQRVESSVPDLMNAEEKWVTNGASEAKLEFMVVADTGYALLATHRLSKINDIAVGTSYSINPGDKLTFTMSIANVGSKPAKPGTITVSYTSGLKVGASDNTSAWRSQNGALVYTHGGAALGVSETHIVEYVLRVADTAAGSGQTISSSATEILDQAGNKVANEQPKSTLQFSVAGSASNAQREGTGYLGIKLSKVNGQAAEGSAAISPLDVLTFSLGIVNRSQGAARPGEIVVVLPSGMMLGDTEKLGTGWTAAGNTLRYAWSGNALAAGETRNVEFTAQVREGTSGDQAVTAETAGFYDTGNRLVEGSGNQKAALTVRVGESMRMETRFWLSSVNGKGTGLTGEEGAHPTVRVVPGDALGYTLRATNRGGQSAAPSEYTVQIPDSHEFDAKKNPGWSIVNGLLVYHYSGAMLNPGAHAEVELKLTLKKGVSTGQGAFTFTYDLTQVWMRNGETTDYDGHGQAVIPVQIGGFEKLARTGESGAGLLPLLLGAALLCMGGSLAARARRRKAG